MILLIVRKAFKTLLQLQEHYSLRHPSSICTEKIPLRERTLTNPALSLSFKKDLMEIFNHKAIWHTSKKSNSLQTPAKYKTWSSFKMLRHYFFQHEKLEVSLEVIEYPWKIHALTHTSGHRTHNSANCDLRGWEVVSEHCQKLEVICSQYFVTQTK